MKLRFDTYTKSMSEALNAFEMLSSIADNLIISIDSYRPNIINVNGDIGTEYIEELTKFCVNEYWNDDANEL